MKSLHEVNNVFVIQVTVSHNITPKHVTQCSSLKRLNWFLSAIDILNFSENGFQNFRRYAGWGTLT